MDKKNDSILPTSSNDELFASTITGMINEPINGTRVVKEKKECIKNVMPKTKGELKILFLSCNLSHCEVAKKYVNKNGFNDVAIEFGHNCFIYDYLPKLKDYDIVIAENEMFSQVALGINEIYNEQISKDRKTYLFLYEMSNSICKYNAVRVRGVSTDPLESICKEEVSYFGDNEVGMKIVFDLIMRSYSKYNKLKDYEPIEDFSAYEKYAQERRQYDNSREQKISNINNLRCAISFFTNACKQGIIDSRIKSFLINQISDGLSMSMFVDAREIASITFLDKDIERYDYAGTFHLQRLSEEGELLSPKKVMIPTYDYKDTIRNAISDDELKVVNTIIKKVNEELMPEYHRLEQERLKREAQYNQRRVRKWD